MKKLLSIFVLVLVCLGATAQTVTLTFTGRDAGNRFIPLNRVVITNVTQNWSETIYYPDTILMLGSTGINELGGDNKFALSQNVPNPFDGTTDFSLQLPISGNVALEVYDLNGKKITSYHGNLPAGIHTFKVLLSTSQSYLLTARCGKEAATIKMVNNGRASENAIRYLGAGRMYPLIAELKGGVKGQTDKPFAVGDEMEYIGYAIINGKECESVHIKQNQNESETFVLSFAQAVLPQLTVQTLPVSQITYNQAQFNAHLSTDRTDFTIERGFQYGTDNGFNNATFVACGQGEGDFSVTVTNLQDSTLYFVRAFGLVEEEYTYGEPVSFTTICLKPIITIEGDNSICQGSSTQLTASGADRYLWSPSSGLNTTTDAVVTASPRNTTTYSVTGTKNNGCSNTADVVVTVNPVTTTNVTESICEGDSYDFYGKLLTEAGVYTHKLTSSYGCDSTINLTLSVKTLPIITITGNTTICEGSSTVLMAKGASTYQWMPSTGLSDATGSIVTASPTSTTYYFVIGTASNGCSNTADVKINVNPSQQTHISGTICPGESYDFFGRRLYVAGTYSHTLKNSSGCDSIIILTLEQPALTITGNLNICEGSSTVLTAKGCVNYQWSPSAGLNTTTGSVVVASPSQTTYYTVTGTSVQGCNLTAGVNVEFHPNYYDVTLNRSICQNDSYDFFGQKLTASGTYTQTLKSEYGCDSVITLNLIVNSLPNLKLTGNTTICAGEKTTLTVSGATSYQWSPAEGLDATDKAVVEASPTTTTTYTVIGTDDNGCANTLSRNVTVQALPVITIAGPSEVNYGSSVTLTASGATTYKWNTGETSNKLTDQPETTTTYSVTGENTYGCSSTVSKIVTVNPIEPAITTLAVSDITDSSAVFNSVLVSHGGDNQLTHGFHYSLKNDFSDYETVSTGDYTIAVTGLEMGTTYFVRAFASNKAGTSFGEVITFATATCDLPSVTTNQVQETDMSKNVVFVSGQVTDNGGCPVLNQGFCWSTGAYPSINDDKISVNNGSDNFSAELTNLKPMTTYYMRIFAVGHAGVAYGNKVQFTTLSDNLADITTNEITNLQATSATCGGKITWAGHTVTARGVCWSTAPKPTLADNHTTDGTGVGSFTSSITGLSDSVTYYVRAYATIDEGTSYGNEVQFTTLSLPVVETAVPTNITANTVVLGGEVVNQGVSVVTERGVCYALVPNPTIASDRRIVGDGVGEFSCSLTGLNSGATYYVRAYAVNSKGTAYGEEKTFTTEAFTCGTSVVKDVENNAYNTVQIGNRCWMKENLRTTKTPAGNDIALGTDTSSVTAYRYYPNDDNTLVETYGYLYNWAAIMKGEAASNANPSAVQGICPTGWHLPSDDEFSDMQNSVSNELNNLCDDNSAYIAKALASTTGWNSSTNTCAVGNTPSTNNATGFSALPAGDYLGSYGYFGKVASFWSATERGSGGAYYRSLHDDNANVIRYFSDKFNGRSVRCLCDVGVPKVITNSISDSPEKTTVTCGGNVTAIGGAAVTARGVCWSTSPNPTIADTHTTDESGTGGFTSNMMGLAGETTYYVRAYATNSFGTAYGEERSFTKALVCGTHTVRDVEENIYNTVKIGEQCWMKENLKTTRYVDGTSIAQGSLTSTTEGFWYYPNNNESNKATYGLLYNWKAVMHNASSSNTNPSNVQGVCPTGWHVPSNAEWTQLSVYIKSQSQYVCGYYYNGYKQSIVKALASTTGWSSSTTVCSVGNTPSDNNATGFSALPAGFYSGSYRDFGYEAQYWSATSYNRDNGDNAYSYGLISDSAELDRSSNGSNKMFGYSVRCLHD